MHAPHLELIAKARDFIKRSDWPVLPFAVGIVVVGVLVQWSVALETGFPSTLFIRIGVGVAAGCAAAMLPAKFWRDHAYLFYGGCVVLLVYVLVSGAETNNARRWIELPLGFKLQPSEFMKLALILTMAKYFADMPRARKFSELVVPGVLAGFPFLLVMAEPDLGTALTYLPIFVGLAYLSGAKRRAIMPVILAPLIIAPIGAFMLRDYQAERIATWWNQSELTAEQKASTGYHLWHSKMAIGSGGVAGFGWGEGPENRMQRLPERNTDFIFSVLSEEMGFLGAVGFVLLYACLAGAALWSSVRHRDPFTRLVVAGVGIHFAVHLSINVGVATGLWPTTGLPLPMVSWGGSSMLASGLAIGAVMSTSADREPILWRSSEA